MMVSGHMIQYTYSVAAKSRYRVRWTHAHGSAHTECPTGGIRGLPDMMSASEGEGVMIMEAA